MPTMTVKNIPLDLYERLKQNALAHRRSLNKEVIFCLEQALRSRRMDTDTILARIETLQERAPLPPLTDEILRKAKEEGRA